MNRSSWGRGAALRAIALFAERKRTTALLVALISASAALDLTVPFITRHLIDGLVNYFKAPAGSAIPMLLGAAAAILVAGTLTRVVRSVYNYRLFRTVTEIEDEVRRSAFDNYLRLHALYHRNANSGQIIGRIDAGCAALFTILYDIAGQSLVPPLLTVSAVMVTLASRNPAIANAVLVPVPAYLLAVRRMTARIYDIEQRGCDSFEAVAKERYDVAGNVVTVKRFSQERAELGRQDGLQRYARSIQYRGDRLWVVVDNLQNFIATLGRVAVIVISGWLVIAGRSTVGEFFLLVSLAEMAYYPIAQLSVILPRLRRSVARAERLFGVIDDRAQVLDLPGAPPLPPMRAGIEFRDVWFRYEDSSRWALEGVGLYVPAGLTVALVGRSGSGKTTFVNLLLRMFDPQRGAVLVDGADIRDVTQESLRSQIAVVPQETDLFSRTIAENIGYGRPGATHDDIVEAARIAQAHDFIFQTEKGYDTVVGERGLKLSGGERQRIGIARAVLRDPRILILDEATSHLDSENERLIQQATARVVQGRTSFIVAHRLSTILHADLIVVFDQGRIEAVGTHTSLLETSPTYACLYTLFSDGEKQFRGTSFVPA
jgi:ABC-type multidrug transport system fused ATPase/permease subunit